MIDIHAHILPFIDDGAVSWEEAVEMCNMAYYDGIRAIVATPHIMDGLYPNKKTDIVRKVEELRERIEVPLSVLWGADVRVSADLVSRIKAGIIPTINDKNYLLLELPFDRIPPNFDRLIFDMQMNGITPVLTHPERCLWVKGNLKPILSRFIELGMIIQMNAGSLTGAFGKEAKAMASEMLRSGLVHVVASDCHSTKDRPPVLSSALTIMESMIGINYRKLVYDNPEKIIEGLPIT